MLGGFTTFSTFGLDTITLVRSGHPQKTDSGDECPYVSGAKRDHLPLEDPKGKPAEKGRELQIHVENILAKLDVKDRTSAANVAQRRGIVHIR